MPECQRCRKRLTGRQRRWCSHACHLWGTRNQQCVDETITDAKLAEVKAMYPSCARDWDVEMVDKAWDRLSFLLPRRLARIGDRVA